MPGSALRLPYELLKLGRKTTDQQLWCLGVDVRVPGFPLKELGWEFHPRPSKKRGCAKITGVLPSEGHLSLWGFGFVACDAHHGACWMDRKSFRPTWASGYAPNRTVFEKKDLPRFTPPQTPTEIDTVLFLLSELATRLAEHEEDVLAMLGVSYREKSLKDWPQAKQAMPPEELPKVWRSIADAALTQRAENYSFSSEEDA